MKRRMHVSMIGYGLHPPWNEGCVNIAHDIASALKDSVNVFTISITDPYRLPANGKLSDNTELVRNIDSNSVFRVFRTKGKYNIPNQVLDIYKVLSRLKSIDHKFGIDILHVFNVSTVVSSISTKMILKKPIVAHVMSAFSIGDSLSEKFVDAFICTSKTVLDDLAYNGVPVQKLYIVPPIIDCNIYKPLSHHFVRKSRCSKRFVLTYIGNLHPQRFPTEILSNFRRLFKYRKMLKLNIHCPDTMVNRKNVSRLKKSLSKLNIPCSIIVSNLSLSEKVVLYNRADALIFPFTEEIERDEVSSLKSSRIFAIDPPLTILESMACGKIVVSSAALSIPEIIRTNENGFLVKPGDFEGFVDTLENVIASFSELQHIGDNARKTIEDHFSSAKIGQRLMNVYSAVLK